MINSDRGVHPPDEAYYRHSGWQGKGRAGQGMAGHGRAGQGGAGQGTSRQRKADRAGIKG